LPGDAAAQRLRYFFAPAAIPVAMAIQHRLAFTFLFYSTSCGSLLSCCFLKGRTTTL